MTKVCRDCGQEKDISEFSPGNNYKDGYSNKCKACHRRQSEEYRQRNWPKCAKCGRPYQSRKGKAYCRQCLIKQTLNLRKDRPWTEDCYYLLWRLVKVRNCTPVKIAQIMNRDVFDVVAKAKQMGWVNNHAHPRNASRV